MKSIINFFENRACITSCYDISVIMKDDVSK